MPKIAILLVTAALLGGCGLAPVLGLQEEVDLATEHGATVVAKAIDAHCIANGQNIPMRQQALAKLNAKTQFGDMLALDCATVGTPGQPDFLPAPTPLTPAPAPTP